MSVKENRQPDPADKGNFPPMLALQIVRKAAALAVEFEDSTLTKLAAEAQAALSDGMHPREVARVLKLT